MATDSPKEACDPYQASVEKVWYDPTTYDAQAHGPDYLPRNVRLASNRKASARKLASEAFHPDSAQSVMGVPTLPTLLAVLRASSFVHQAHHWQTNGSSFYGDHLLFERLYSESQAFIDQLAERTVGTAGAEAVDAQTQAQSVANLVVAMCNGSLDPTDMVQMSLMAESLVVQAVSLVLGALQDSGELSNGTDNLLQGVSDLHEGFVYLLGQRAAQPKAYEYGR